ncbi:nucleotidyltransferase domain-containing protein [Bacillus sp. FJAT-53711]|uniref:Nucleotidyltransferase domain-containing protein n=1 Tax=Bacillus yunxiaonensis TaxID=3127665 RepID=A0ABU8G238_9BACI
MQKHEKVLRHIQNCLLETPFVKVAYIFGSHARKEAIPSSDYDIAIETTNISIGEFQWLWFQLMEELDGAGKVDAVHLNTLSNSELKRHILREGRLFAQRI